MRLVNTHGSRSYNSGVTRGVRVLACQVVLITNLLDHNNVLLQDGKTLDNEIEVVEGMKFDRGYISPYFVTDSKTQICELENPLILIVEKKVGETLRHTNSRCKM